MRKQDTRLLLIKYLLSTQAGFSLIESLVAVVVVSILLAAIVPMVVLSTASRIQARRVDLATQAARSYVDGVRANVINIIDPVASFPYIDDTSNWVGTSRSQYFQSVPAPTNATVSTLNLLPGIKVDTNGDGFSVDDPQDLFIQPMRSGSTDATILKKQGFWLAVRVYRADALSGSAALRDGTESTCNTGRTAFSNTASITCPIVTVRSQILPTTNANNLDDIKTGIGSTP